MRAQAISNDVLQQRQHYYEAISQQNLTPLWEVLGALVSNSYSDRPIQQALGLWREEKI